VYCFFLQLFRSFPAFAEAALADEFVLVSTGNGRQGLAAKQPAAAEPEPSSLSLETGELPQDSTAEAAAAAPAAAAAEASNVVLSPPGQACELNAPAALPPPVANNVLPRKRSGRIPIPVPVALPDDADMAWLESAVADVLHPQGEEERQQQQQQEGGGLSRDRSSVWERLGGAFGNAQTEAGSPKAAATARSPSPALAGRLRPELQVPLQRNRSKELPSPALASRLQPVPMPYDSRPSPKQQQQLPSVPQLPPATIDLLDLAIVDAFVEHAGRRKQQRVCAEMGWQPAEHPAVREELQQQDAEMPLEVCSAGSVANPHSCPVRLALVQLSFVPGLLDAAPR
jgi:hypothetical protein